MFSHLHGGPKLHDLTTFLVHFIFVVHSLRKNTNNVFLHIGGLEINIHYVPIEKELTGVSESEKMVVEQQNRHKIPYRRSRCVTSQLENTDYSKNKEI